VSKNKIRSPEDGKYFLEFERLNAPELFSFTLTSTHLKKSDLFCERLAEL